MKIAEKIVFLKNEIGGFDRINVRFIDKNKKKCIEKIYYAVKNGLENDKKAIRAKFREERSRLDLKALQFGSLKLNRKILNLEEFKKAETVFCYISFDREIETGLIIDHCLKTGKILCVPVIKNGIMAASIIDNMKNLSKNKYGILEPITVHEIHKNRIDVTIVPALGYNYLGFRVGYGRGYYDNFLKDYHGFTIGMAFKNFVNSELVPDDHDIPVKKLIIQ